MDQELTEEGLRDRLAVVERSLYDLSNQVRRAILNHDELRDRLSSTERAVHQLVTTLQQQSAPAAPTGLPLGTPAPDFALPDLRGRVRRLADYGGTPLLLVFFSPTCGYCQRMAPQLGQLPAGGPRMLLISSGDRKEHRRLAAEHHWSCDVVLDEPALEVMRAYQAAGTPTGYLLDAEGRTASPLTVGADTLLALLSETPPAAEPVASTTAGEDAATESANVLTAETLRAKQEAATERVRAAGLRAGGESRVKRDGLAAGTPAPDFTLPDVRGVQRSLAEFRGQRVLLVFSDTSCVPCQALAPQLVALHQQHRAANLELIMVSRGGALANRAKAREHGLTFPVLLQKNWEVSKDYAIFATPVGYLIDEEGMIARDVAVGAEAILQLV